MKSFFDNLIISIQDQLQSVDIEGSEITIQESFKMIDFIKRTLFELRIFFLENEPKMEQDEIIFFKEMKPQILSLLIYFNKIHTIELKRPNGSNEIQRDYYIKEQDNLTYFFEKNLDFYQYYRSNSSHLDKYYFLRNKICPNLCVDSSQFIQDPEFSTGFDFKVSKILANEMLRIYLNKKLNNLDKHPIRVLSGMNNVNYPIKWTASKAAAIELGYAVFSSGVFNHGNIEIRDIMSFMEIHFGIDLGDYYRAYITIKSRKKDRTAFLRILIENLIKRMDDDDTV